MTPLGIFLLVKAIRLLIKVFNGKMIIEMPFLTKEMAFDIPEDGIYSIWQKGQFLRKTPVGTFKPVVLRQPQQELVQLSHSLLSPKMNDFETARMELYTFSANKGSYLLKIDEREGVSKMATFLSGILPNKMVDLDRYFLQIRVAQPFYLMLIAIPFTLLSFGLTVGGFIMGLIANESLLRSINY